MLKNIGISVGIFILTANIATTKIIQANEDWNNFSACFYSEHEEYEILNNVVSNGEIARYTCLNFDMEDMIGPDSIIKCDNAPLSPKKIHKNELFCISIKADINNAINPKLNIKLQDHAHHIFSTDVSLHKTLEPTSSIENLKVAVKTDSDAADNFIIDKFPYNPFAPQGFMRSPFTIIGMMPNDLHITENKKLKNISILNLSSYQCKIKDKKLQNAYLMQMNVKNQNNNNIIHSYPNNNLKEFTIITKKKQFAKFDMTLDCSGIPVLLSLHSTENKILNQVNTNFDNNKLFIHAFKVKDNTTWIINNNGLDPFTLINSLFIS